jgi:hypothetical protein
MKQRHEKLTPRPNATVECCYIVINGNIWITKRRSLAHAFYGINKLKPLGVIESSPFSTDGRICTGYLVDGKLCDLGDDKPKNETSD